MTWGYHANDNAFLNYGDAWFKQRTLVVRFEMNKTNTVEVRVCACVRACVRQLHAGLSQHCA